MLSSRQTRENFKLWSRIDADDTPAKDCERYRAMLAREEVLMFPGLSGVLEQYGDGRCSQCHYRQSYGARDTHHFGGVSLCEHCRSQWRMFLETLPERAGRAFPEFTSHLALPNAAVSID